MGPAAWLLGQGGVHERACSGSPHLVGPVKVYEVITEVDYITSLYIVGQSPLRRSYSDQAFGRTPPGTPTHSKQALHSQSP